LLIKPPRIGEQGLLTVNTVLFNKLYVNMNKYTYFLLFCLICCNATAQVANNNLVPIKHSQPDTGLNDLFPASAFLSNKKIVALGEATHGTKEFFELKHRLINLLSDSLGYNIIFMEMMYNSSQTLNNYILNGIGTQKEVMRAIGFDVYQTEEIWHLIEWIKEANKNKTLAKKIKFYGIDMQAILSGGLNLRRFVNSIDATSITQFDTIAQPFYSDSLLRVYMYSGKKGIKPQTKEYVHRKIAELENWFVLSKKKYLETTPENELNLITYQINTIKQAFDFYEKLNGGYQGISNYRDSCMASNLQFVLSNYPSSAKSVLWAHNAHVTKKIIYKTKPLGYYLNQLYKQEYYAVGFVFNYGAFRALKGPQSLVSGVFKLIFTPKKVYSKSFEIITVKPLKSKNALSKRMESLKLPYFFLNFDKNSLNNTDFKWVSEPLAFYELGATYTFLHTNELKLIEAFDGVIYIDKTSAAVPLGLW
jgi:erythromycin esterase